MNRPSSRIAAWLRDYDPLLSIRWSMTLKGWVLERKAKEDIKLLAQLHRRVNLAFDTSESGSEPSIRMEVFKLRAQADMEAMGRGNRFVLAVPDPLHEGNLKKLVIGSDTWRNGSPDHLGADEAVRRATDPVYDQKRKEREKELQDQRSDIRFKAQEAADYFFWRQGSRAFVPSKTFQQRTA